MRGLLTKACTIKLQNFEGPLDLLFHFIEKSKISIYNIEVSEITEQYMRYLYTMQKLDMDIASEFLVMAATLLHIKSKSMLPIERTSSKGNSEDDIETEEDLILRLIEYKKIKEAAKALRDMENEWAKVFYRDREGLKFKPVYQMSDMLPEDLQKVYESILERRVSLNPEDRFIPLLKTEKVSVKDKIFQIVRLLKKRLVFRFFEVFKRSKAERHDIVAGFMAILELAKLNKVHVVQDGLFEEIYVHRQK